MGRTSFGICGDFPEFAMAFAHTVDELVYRRPAGLAQTVVPNRSADGMEFDPEPQEQPQERRLHHGDDMRDVAG